jgi:hypothetical protein
MQRPGSLQYNSQRINPGVVVVRELTKDRLSLLRVQTAVERASRLQHVQFFSFGKQRLSTPIKLSLLFPLLQLQRPFEHTPRQQLVRSLYVGQQ